jgi:hypothetical protein
VQRIATEAPPGQAPGASLDEYLGKRETAQTVPTRGALSVHPEIPDTLRSKPMNGALERAAALGHRLGSTFTVNADSPVTPGGATAPPAVVPAPPAAVPPPPSVGAASVQRKVGFEFETNVDLATEDGKPIAGYTAPIFTAKNGLWEIQTDNSHMEFVTKEQEETEEGKAVLVKGQMAEIETWAQKMFALTQKAPKKGKVEDVAPELGTAATYKTQKTVVAADSLSAAKMYASPQASGGVTLDKVPELIDAIYSLRLEHLKKSPTFKAAYDLEKESEAPVKPEEPKSTGIKEDDEEAKALYEIKLEGYNDMMMMHQMSLQVHENQRKEVKEAGLDTKDLAYSAGGMNLIDPPSVGRARQQAKGAIAMLKNHYATELKLKFPEHGFKSFEGLLALVLSYIHTGSLDPQPLPYSKVIAPLMSRTNFYSLYRLLEKEEQEAFIVDNVLGFAELDDGPLFRGGFKLNKLTEKGPLRSEWIQSIIDGTNLGTKEEPKMAKADLLSQGSGSTAARSSSSLGAFPDPDESLKKKKELAVLELRRLPREQALQDWTPTALAIFELFQKLSK